MFNPAAPPRPSKLAAAAVMMVVFAYLAAFHSYGLELADEGTILYQIHRAASGLLPYRDFATGYTPGFFWLNALVFRTFGESVGILRFFLLGVHGLSALGFLLLSGWLMRPALAVWPAILWFAFLPVFPGQFSSFNIPYPAWYATVGFVWAAVAALRWREGGRSSWLVVASLACAFALACKPNTGAFAFAALGMVILRAGQAARDPLWWVAWTGVLGVLGLAFGFRILSADFCIYLFPLVVVMVLLATGRVAARRRCPSASGGLGAWATVAGAAGAVTLPWAAFLVAVLGLGRFVREVTLIGSGAEMLYYIPFPALTRVPAAIAVAFSLLGITGILLARARSAALARVVVITVVAGTVAAALVSGMGAVMPEGITKSIIWQLESASFPLSLAVQWTAIAMLGGRLAQAATVTSRRGPLPARAEVLLIFALCGFLQLYPRADFMHLVNAAPFTLIIGFFLLALSISGWESACRRLSLHSLARLFRPVVLVAISGMVVLRVLPNLNSLAAPRYYSFTSTRGELRVESTEAEALAELDEVVRVTRRLTSANDTVFAFPALAAVNFFSEREAPIMHDYFFAGRPDHSDEAKILDFLLDNPPRLVIALHRNLTFFQASPAYYFLLRGFVNSHYEFLGQIGRFDILGRHGLGRGKMKEALPGGSGGFYGWERQQVKPAFESPQEEIRRLVTVGVSRSERRRVLLGLLDRLAGQAADVGLEQWVQSSRLSRAQELLFLRAIRDFGDERAASYLVETIKRPDQRLASDAEGAMYVLGDKITLRNFLWARDRTSAKLAIPRAEWLREQLIGWLVLGDVPPRARAFAAKVLGVIGAEASRRVLVDRFARDSDPAVRIAAAEALTMLGADGLGCPLVGLLGRTVPEIRNVVPSLILESYRRAPDKVRPCLSVAIARGARKGAAPGVVDRAREAIWIAAASQDEDIREPLAAAKATGPEPVAAAAKWALAHFLRDQRH